MIFFIIMGTLCIFLNVNAKSRLRDCPHYGKHVDQINLSYTYGIVCTKTSCDWNVDSTCKNGTYSKVLQWETDIFEIGFEQMYRRRPREVVVKIDLNDDYYIEIKVISDKEKRTVIVILNECSYKEKKCLEIRNVPHDDVSIYRDSTFVAIGFRKDKKINFAALSKGHFSRATNLFDKDNVYEFKTPGFYFNTEETMKITVYSKFDENYDYNGVVMILPTSVGGFFFNEHGYLVRDTYKCYDFYDTSDEEKGLLYILREYFNNSENWKANVVKDTFEVKVPYFDADGMKFKPEQMKIKEEKNPNFDETKMIRKGCKYVEKPNIDSEPDFTETTTTEFTTTEEETTETTKQDDLKKKSISTPMPPPPKIKGQLEGSLNEREIRINETVLIPRLDPSEKFLDLYDLFERAGNKSFDENYFNNVGKGGDDYNVKLKNGSDVDLKGYKFKIPSKKDEKNKKTTTKKIISGGSGGSGGSEGAGDASRGQKQLKIISPKYFVILILMILSV